MPMSRWILNLGGVAMLGAMAGSVGEVYAGDEGMKLGVVVGVVFGALIVAVLNSNTV